MRCAACRTTWIARASEALQAEPVATLAAPEPPPASEAMPAVPPGGGDPASEPAGPASALAAAAPPVPTARRPWHERFGQVRSRASAGTGRKIAAALVVALTLSAALGLRRHIVAAVPETGAVYAAIGLPVNLRGLEFHGVKSIVINDGGVDMLVVQGDIVNVANKKVALPRLAFAVRDAKGAVIYSWTAQADVRDLQPGQTHTFRRRLASPPQDGQDVLVRFASRADLVASAR